MTDWEKTFGHPGVLIETFVDPQRLQGTVYRTANWLYVGNTKGFKRIRHGYTATTQSPKMVSLKSPAGCSGTFMPSHAPTILSYRKLQNHAHRQPDAIPPFLLCGHPRSPQGPKPTPPTRHGLGHCHRRQPMWHARIPGDRGLGQKSWPESPPLLVSAFVTLTV